MTLSVSASRMMVPAGTFTMISAPFLPWQLRFLPSSPFSAAYLRRCLKSVRVFKPSSTWKMTSPPFPPSPPSGPPFGTYFSRRKLTCPSPPFPDFIIILALSANISFFSFFIVENRPGYKVESIDGFIIRSLLLDKRKPAFCLFLFSRILIHHLLLQIMYHLRRYLRSHPGES